jgi:serine protease Do
MKTFLALILAAALLPAFAPAARAQSLGEIFRKVSPTVVVVRSKGRDVGAGGVTRVNETGSGVLISDSGRVTAAHVVNGMDEITVEGIAGEVVRATIVSANAAADVSLLQLERVTAAMRVAAMGDSDTVRVGRQVMVVGAPYGLAYSLSVDDIPVVSEDNIEQIRNGLAGVPRGTPFKMNVLRAGKVLVLTGTTRGKTQ